MGVHLFVLFLGLLILHVDNLFNFLNLPTILFNQFVNIASISMETGGKKLDMCSRLNFISKFKISFLQSRNLITQRFNSTLLIFNSLMEFSFPNPKSTGLVIIFIPFIKTAKCFSNS